MKALILWFGLALVAPAHAETMAELRLQLASTAVEDSIAAKTGNQIIVTIDREAPERTFVRWSRNPLRYVQDTFDWTMNLLIHNAAGLALSLFGRDYYLLHQSGWVLVFEGTAFKAGSSEPVGVNGVAFFRFTTLDERDQVCHTAGPGTILLKFADGGSQSFDGAPFSECRPVRR